MKLFVPFRYKLTAIIALITVAMLYAIFSVVQQDIELKFRRLIEDRLLQAKGYVSQRMDDRYLLLRNDATATVNDKLVLDVLTDKTLSTITRNDIITSEVLPKFSNLSLLAVTDANGKLRAQQSNNAAVTAAMIDSDWFSYALEGESVAGYVLHDKTVYQGIAMPVFLAQEMFGIVIAGRELTVEDIKQIKQTSEIDIAVLSANHTIVTTDFSGVTSTEQLQQAFEQWLNQVPPSQLKRDKTLEVKLGQERFLLQLAVDDTMFVPPYIIARSLDESLAFVNNIRDDMKALGIVSILLAIVTGFLFAVGIASPIKILSKATEEVANENFEHRVEISSIDEFSGLGESFNRMIVGLDEKQKIRRAFDKSVSKEVADHMLNRGTQLGGHSEYATILFADIRGFTTLSEELDENALINLLNEYFSSVNRCITEEQGVIDKFIGDALMALFGTPIACDHCAYHGLMAARRMLQTVQQFNHQAKLIYGCELNIGIGLNSGQVVAGMVGSDDRLNFTVLGDQVNIASRVEGLCKHYGVSLICSESTVQDIQEARSLWAEPVQFRRLDRVQVKGKTSGIDIYQPMFTDDSAIIERLAAYEVALGHVIDGDLQAAVDLLKPLSLQWSEDKPTELLYQACRHYLENPDFYRDSYREGARVLNVK